MVEKDKINLNDKKMFSDELIGAVENQNNEDNIGRLLNKLVDGEPKNVNPLTEMPSPKMRLYGFLGGFKKVFFDTEDKLLEYVKTHNISYGSIGVMDYLGKVAGCSDVIRLTYKSGESVLYTSVDEDGYGKYNPERSIYRGEFIWEYQHGNIREMYSAFRDRGIVFENDTYAKIDEYHRNLMDMCEERRIFTGNERKISSESQKSNETPKFDVLAVPCNRTFVVSSRKAEEFKNVKLDSVVRKQIEEVTEKFNNLTEEGMVLKKTIKFNNK